MLTGGWKLKESYNVTLLCKVTESGSPQPAVRRRQKGEHETAGNLVEAFTNVPQ